jgi:hypothetical protein
MSSVSASSRTSSTATLFRRLEKNPSDDVAIAAILAQRQKCHGDLILTESDGDYLREAVGVCFPRQAFAALREVTSQCPQAGMAIMERAVIACAHMTGSYPSLDDTDQPHPTLLHLAHEASHHGQAWDDACGAWHHSPLDITIRRGILSALADPMRPDLAAVNVVIAPWLCPNDCSYMLSQRWPQRAEHAAMLASWLMRGSAQQLRAGATMVIATQLHRLAPLQPSEEQDALVTALATACAHGCTVAQQAMANVMAADH